jgi:hypothetical protein
MATLLNTELPEPRWEDYESYATWETNVTRLIQASSDFINNRPTPQRQFEELEDEAMPLPTIIRARTLLKTKPERVKRSSVAPSVSAPVPKSKSKAPAKVEIKVPKKRGRPPKVAQKDSKPKEAPVKPIAIPPTPAKRGRKPKVAIPAEGKASSVRKAPAVVIPVPPVKRGRKPKASVAVNGKANGALKTPSIPAKKAPSKKAKVTQLSRSQKSAMETARLRELNHRRRILRRRRTAPDSSKN